MRKLSTVMSSILALMFVVGITSLVAADQIPGCFRKNHGQLRVVNDHSECLNSEIPIYLNGSFQPQPPPPFLPEGEYCWQTQVEEGTAILQLGVFYIGNKHYLVSGKIIINRSNNNVEELSIYGNAEIFSDNKIHMSLSHGYTTTNGTGGDIWNFVLDDDLNGVAHGVNVWVEFDESGFQIEYDGPMPFVLMDQCP